MQTNWTIYEGRNYITQKSTRRERIPAHFGGVFIDFLRNRTFTKKTTTFRPVIASPKFSLPVNIHRGKKMYCFPLNKAASVQEITTVVWDQLVQKQKKGIFLYFYFYHVERRAQKAASRRFGEPNGSFTCWRASAWARKKETRGFWRQGKATARKATTGGWRDIALWPWGVFCESRAALFRSVGRTLWIFVCFWRTCFFFLVLDALSVKFEVFFFSSWCWICTFGEV